MRTATNYLIANMAVSLMHNLMSSQSFLKNQEIVAFRKAEKVSCNC